MRLYPDHWICKWDIRKLELVDASFRVLRPFVHRIVQRSHILGFADFLKSRILISHSQAFNFLFTLLGREWMLSYCWISLAYVAGSRKYFSYGVDLHLR